MKRFVVFAAPRSGTTFFNSVLNRHPAMHSWGEVLPGIGQEHQFHTFWLEKVRKDPAALLLSDVAEVFAGYLEDICSPRPGLEGVEAVGIDIKYYQLEWKPEFLRVLQEAGFHVLHIVRRNLLRRYVSWVLHFPENRALANRPMHSGKFVASERLVLETGDFLLQDLREMRDKVMTYEVGLQKHFSYRTFYYEEMIDAARNTLTDETLAGVYDMLGITDRDADLSSPLRKLNPVEAKHSIDNYHEVVATLAGTEFESLLDSPEYDIAHADMFRHVAEGRDAFMRGDGDEALRRLKTALAMDAEYAESLFLMGALHCAAGQVVKGVPYFAKALENVTDPARPYDYAHMLSLLAPEAYAIPAVRALFPEP